MSNFGADLLSNRAGNGSPNIMGGELARCRFRLNGTGVIADIDSFNVSSYVDVGTGNYTVNFSVAFPNDVYAAQLTGDSSGVIAVRYGFMRGGDAVQTANSMRIGTVDSAGSGADAAVNGAVFGDKP